MTVRKVQIERLSVISSKRFEEVLATLEAAIGHQDMVEFMKETDAAHTFAEFARDHDKGLSKYGLDRMPSNEYVWYSVQMIPIVKSRNSLKLWHTQDKKF